MSDGVFGVRHSALTLWSKLVDVKYKSPCMQSKGGGHGRGEGGEGEERSEWKGMRERRG